MRVLVFGDSITQGFWDSEGGWVARIRKHFDALVLKDRNYDHPSVFNLGISADTTRNLLARFEAEIDARAREDLALVVSIGVNDSHQAGTDPIMSLNEYGENIAKLIVMAKKYTEKILFVGLSPVVESRTTPVSWGDYNYTNNRLIEFDSKLKQSCLEGNVGYVEIFHKLQGAQQSSEHFTDGLQPDDNGHQLIADIVLPEIKKLVT